MRSGAEASRVALGGSGLAGRSQSPLEDAGALFLGSSPALAFPVGVLAGARSVQGTPGPSASHWLQHQHVSQPSQQPAAPAAPDVGPASRPSCCSCWQCSRPSSPWSPSLDSLHAHQVVMRGWVRPAAGYGEPSPPWLLQEQGTEQSWEYARSRSHMPVCTCVSVSPRVPVVFACTWTHGYVCQCGRVHVWAYCRCLHGTVYIGAQACVTLTNRTGFLCGDRRSCISASQVCDGLRTCPHGDDEDESLCRECPLVMPCPDQPSRGWPPPHLSLQLH
ncbi:hypothetical protein GHT09_000162 [Marmota monax]|uniref:Uncharacterized protein n=1 Tax=Marmota monax TaxID=9995 RepID=A0A834PWL0_MARMO|nr:hypothetical protein GHT09_000162 [Marmota monax]